MCAGVETRRAEWLQDLTATQKVLRVHPPGSGRSPQLALTGRTPHQNNGWAS